MMPITDDHMHIDLKGLGITAVEQFQRAGGTHIFLVSKTAQSFGIEVTSPDDFKSVFEQTIRIAGMINEQTKVTAFPILGIHPVELTRLAKRFELDKAKQVIYRGLEIAIDFVKEGHAIAIKTGRPHYEVSDAEWHASNEIMSYGMKLASEVGCAVQLHTESTTPEGLAEIAKMASNAGLTPDKIVKHYSPPMISAYQSIGIFPSILASEDALNVALSQGDRFMMETDYIDDFDRPGVVLGPKTVPRRTKQFIKKGIDEDVFWAIHKDHPEKVYGVTIDI
ncbi:MAG: TatD family hydrolase [Methanosarcinales archaeon]|nr:MAG: TatD family hydrolase [Methanosarcinales archaeon]